MGEFKIGDRVRCLEDDEGNAAIIDEVGTVIHQLEPGVVGVEFDVEFPDGHDCNGHAENYHGWYVFEDFLVLEEASEQTPALSFSFADFLSGVPADA